MKKAIWKDSIARRVMNYVFVLFIYLVLLWYLWAGELKTDEFMTWFGWIVGVLLATFGLFNLLRTKPTKILEKGIFMGNIVNDEYAFFNVKHKPTVITWNEIKKISIENRKFARFLLGDRINILIIKTKDEETYECQIKRVKEFIETLKNLHKDNLLLKNSNF